MNMRARQLWAPVLFTFLVSVSVQFVALRVPQLPPWVIFTRNGVSVVLAPLWMLALPFIGALTAAELAPQVGFGTAHSERMRGVALPDDYLGCHAAAKPRSWLLR